MERINVRQKERERESKMSEQAMMNNSRKSCSESVKVS